MFFINIFIIFLIIKIITGQFEDEYTINARAGIVDKLFDGDIDLRPEEYYQLKRSKFFSDPAARKNALFTNWETDEKYHWPHQPSTTQGVRYGPLINYTLDWEKIVEPPSFVWLKNILDAHKNIEENTCIRFANSSEGDHIHYYWGYGCHSLVGRNGGKQWLSLGPGCWTVNAVHETLHALGSNHEQSRQDRDTFIKINEENMIENISDAFAVIAGSPTGNPYDFGSCSTMHYNNMAFSKNKKPTIETLDKNYQHTIGYRLKLSFLDTKALNHRYCEHICDDLTWITPDCRNNGYPNPNKCSECLCPEAKIKKIKKIFFLIIKGVCCSLL
uniref:Metalloendopeptidase n=1 Tax=Meloidogyne incognita TaxID=6306 RepID=A0A914KIS6_MELIC